MRMASGISSARSSMRIIDVVSCRSAAAVGDGLVDMTIRIVLNVGMKSTAAGWTLGELAARSGVATHVLRHWESEDLLSPQQSTAGHRRYRPDDVYRVATILLAKEAGLGLREILAMTTGSAQQRTAVLHEHRTELRNRIAAAQTCLALIECALDCDHEDIGTCPHFRAAVAHRVTALQR